MPQGDKSKYTDKQKRQAAAIESRYKRGGVPEEEAEKRAWATVNKIDGGGKKRGVARVRGAQKPSPKKRAGKTTTRSAAPRSASAKKAARSRAVKKAATTRARNRKKGQSGFFSSLSTAVFGK